ncbi:bis(5'-nucleosyl)-tetraphosphatase (symmetrical) YqeK [Halalkalibacillus halophilus]|uniref:bis(5'-nucleosyl)-tetraphosphatase (symmetrical) YqeK n=1 Tax=Halalkalibacillus halophilus TaxID=392827 RepID=UPI0003FDBE1B|nr:bis(5'-nucleosyl)-tetraphosphatase (symmetrical) YqeK [Halalkalibacillus halophilus]
MNISQALLESKKVMNPKRFEHVERVTETASDLAAFYEVNQTEVGLAAAFHDYCKDFDSDDLRRWIQDDVTLPKDLLHYHHELWHGPVGAKYVSKWYGVDTPEILNGIYYHTTGRRNMSKVEQIVFVADYIEPGRTFPGVEEAREKAYKDLDEACHYALKQTISFLSSKSQPIYPDTFHAYNYFLKKIKNGGLNDGK